MNSRRTLKAASAIREVVSSAILTEIRDPRVDGVTVTFVEVAADMRHAKVHVSIMGDEKKQDLCMHGLRNAKGFLQKRVANRIDTRYTPRIEFVLDQGIKNSFRVAAILDEVLPKDELPNIDSTGNDDVSIDEASDNDASDDGLNETNSLATNRDKELSDE